MKLFFFNLFAAVLLVLVIENGDQKSNFSSKITNPKFNSFAKDVRNGDPEVASGKLDSTSWLQLQKDLMECTSSN